MQVNHLHTIRPDMFVDRAWVCFARVIAHMFSSGIVIHLDILLCSLAQQPEIVHFHRTYLLPLDCVVDNTNTFSVVYVYRGLWLWMSYLVQS